MNGFIFNIQRFSLFDGPGVRTVVFFKGCPLNCKWCHNPEGISKSPELLFNPAKCINCHNCFCCEKGLHFEINNYHSFSKLGCDGCGKCANKCYAQALSIAGKEISSDEIIAEVLKDKMFYKDDGGITLSGGEPLMQYEFALEILKKAKENGISTCIETSGFTSTGIIEKIIPYVDTFLYDYKITGEENHKYYCGVSQSQILSNLDLLDKNNCNVVIRCPIIKGINDNEEHIEGICSVSKFNCVKRIDLEPYHNLGISKLEQMGKSSNFIGEAPEKSVLNNMSTQISNLTKKKCIIS